MPSGTAEVVPRYESHSILCNAISESSHQHLGGRSEVPPLQFDLRTTALSRFDSVFLKDLLALCKFYTPLILKDLLALAPTGPQVTY